MVAGQRTAVRTVFKKNFDPDKTKPINPDHQHPQIGRRAARARTSEMRAYLLKLNEIEARECLAQKGASSRRVEDLQTPKKAQRGTISKED